MQTDLLLDRWTAAQRTFDVTSPYTGEVVASVSDASPDDARKAVDIASTAFETWKRSTAYERSRLLRAWFDLITRDTGVIAELIAREMGKPVTEARGEVTYAASFVEWYAEEAKRTYGETIPSQFGHKRISVLRQPVGVVYAVTPWNFPAAMITRKAAPALAAGCTFILKPPEDAPLTALHLAELWRQAGGPEGTFLVLPTNDPVALTDVMMQDARVRKVTFTGSTEVGKILVRQSASTLKRMSMELGGHAPYIIFEDANLEQAVRDVIACKFRNAGQTCVSTNRVYVQRSIYEAFSREITKAVQALRTGDPLDPDTQIGPLVNQAAVQKVGEHVDDAVQHGARVLTGGTVRGLLYEPTVIADVKLGMRVMNEETFGPVVPLTPFEDEDEVIRAANESPYGLAAYFWTTNLARAHRVSEALEYGIVGLNDPLPSTAQAPFGGVKESGFGREGGHYGLEEYLSTKYVSTSLQ